MEECAIFGGIPMPFLEKYANLEKYAIYGGMCQFLGKCAINGEMKYLWRNVLLDAISKNIASFSKNLFDCTLFAIPWIYCLFVSYCIHFTLSKININMFLVCLFLTEQA